MQNYREGRGQPMKPLIGLTPIVDAGRDSLWMLPGYMQGLEAVGGIGMMLPLTDDAAAVWICDPNAIAVTRSDLKGYTFYPVSFIDLSKLYYEE